MFIRSISLAASTDALLRSVERENSFRGNSDSEQVSKKEFHPRRPETNEMKVGNDETVDCVMITRTVVAFVVTSLSPTASFCHFSMA